MQRFLEILQIGPNRLYAILEFCNLPYKYYVASLTTNEYVGLTFWMNATLVVAHFPLDIKTHATQLTIRIYLGRMTHTAHQKPNCTDILGSQKLLLL